MCDIDIMFVNLLDVSYVWRQLDCQLSTRRDRFSDPTLIKNFWSTGQPCIMSSSPVPFYTSNILYMCHFSIDIMIILEYFN